MRRAIIIAGWVWFAVALSQVTNAGFDFFLGTAVVLSGPAIGLAWVVYSAAWPEVFWAGHGRWAWASVPVAGLLPVLIAYSGFGLVARVWLCDGALRAFAEDVRRDGDRGSYIGTSQWVGLFPIRTASGDADEARLITASSFMDGFGLAYRPEVPPPADDNRYRPLYGPWYWFWDKF